MLTVKQKKCMELMLQGDKTQKEIAEEIKVSQQTICNWKKDTDGFMAEYDRMIRQYLQEAAALASREMRGLMRNKSGMVRYMAAKDILDRTGFRPEEKIDLRGGTAVVITDDLAKKCKDQ